MVSENAYARRVCVYICARVSLSSFFQMERIVCNRVVLMLGLSVAMYNVHMRVCVQIQADITDATRGVLGCASTTMQVATE